MKYILSIDIGGTTFVSGLFTKDLKFIEKSDKDKIRYYKNRTNLVKAIIRQIDTLTIRNKINRKQIIGLGIASPGPIDTINGKILETPNLKMFRNYSIVQDFENRLKIKVSLENDANLFALGEWYQHHREIKVFLGVTLGTGFGLGLVLNKNIYTGGNNMSMEYGMSPFKWGKCEKNISIDYIKRYAEKLYERDVSPREIEKNFYNKDKKAILIYNDFGKNLGQALSHIINIVDPQVVVIGGGLSNAFLCFKDSMFVEIKKYSPSFNINNISIVQSKSKEISTFYGCCINVLNKK